MYFCLLEVGECGREDVACAGILLLLCSASAGMLVSLWAPSPVVLAAVFCCADLPNLLMSVKQGTLLISSVVCCFDKMLFTNKCHVQLLSVSTELCLRGAVQRAESRAVIDARPMV